jgi:hypothetical protein
MAVREAEQPERSLISCRVDARAFTLKNVTGAATN